MSLEGDLQLPRGFLDPHNRLNPSKEPLTPGMRMIVVSWMVEVAEEFRLQQETLHLAIGLLDRFLSSEEVSSSSRTKHGWDMWMIHLAVDTATDKYADVNGTVAVHRRQYIGTAVELLLACLASRRNSLVHSPEEPTSQELSEGVNLLTCCSEYNILQFVYMIIAVHPAPAACPDQL